MVDVTSPDNIAAWTNQDPASIVQESQTQAASIQAALAKRQRYDYVWPTSAERTAQTGMTQGSRGYQVDTKTEYLYDNSNWRLAVSYGEWSRVSGFSVPNASETTLTGLSIDTGLSTDTTFVTVNSGTGVITLVNPGVYAMSLTIGSLSSLGSTNYGAIRPDNTGSLPPISLSGFTAGATTVSVPFYRTASSNVTLYPRMYQSGGGSATTSYIILRIGRLS